VNAKPAPHLEFAPPAQPGMGRSWVVAGVAHMALFVALGVATSWKTKPQTLQAEAELWSAVPIAAAPRLQEPTPPPQPEPEPQPKAAPEPKPEPPPPPAPAPEPDNALRDAQIALEKKKIEDQKKQQAAQRQREAEAKKKAAELQAAKDKAAREKAEKEKAAREKAMKEKAAQEKLAQDKKKAADKAKAEAAEKAKAEAKAKAQADAFRQENLARTQGLAGASGGPNATGTALRSSGPSASYAGRLIGRIKPNITFPGDLAGNPRAEVEVRVAPDGTIISRRIAESSGNIAWDNAVLRAIDKTEILPKDTDGRVPPLIVLGFRPLD
jgi:colicin import membrane protein